MNFDMMYLDMINLFMCLSHAFLISIIFYSKNQNLKGELNQNKFCNLLTFILQNL